MARASVGRAWVNKITHQMARRSSGIVSMVWTTWGRVSFAWAFRRARFVFFALSFDGRCGHSGSRKALRWLLYHATTARKAAKALIIS